ncbi:MAG TPA: sugar ABC transporter permease [Thermotogota bacterium]|nr:sugar ABC transporter permease [Thermotogota bacterium]HRW93067.1 sugar ABC transporter permease [Thermotogota bacterium]
MGRRLSGSRRKEALAFYLCIAPWLFGFLVFTLGPMAFSLYFSFTDWNMFQKPNFVGFKNYVRLFTRDRIFPKALWNTFFYAGISVPLSLFLATLLSGLLNRKLRGLRIFRTIFYLPALIPAAAMSMVFIWMLAPDTGLINRFLGVFGVDGPAWLLDRNAVKPALIIMSLWGVGNNILLLLAGMQGIPQQLYEAARLDGAGRRQAFLHITIPMISPILFFNLVMGMIGGLQTFTQVYIMTDGGPNNASMMMVPYLFHHAFDSYRMGYASSIAWVLFLIILGMTLLVFRSSSLWVFYESEVRR